MQQGDPLGSTLFALGLHPILNLVAEQNPHLLIEAFADNVFLVYRQSRLLSAADSLIREAAEIDLSLTPR